MQIRYKLWMTLLLLVLKNAGIAQNITDICENVVPANWKAINSNLSISGDHYKQGLQSVEWNFRNSALITITDTAFNKVAANKRACFAFWIYNEKPLQDSLQFKFKNAEKTVSSFSFGLNFKGWRTAWVMYHRDMKGKPDKGITLLDILAPASVNEGRLFFDHVVLCTTVDPRAPMRDMQVPFVNPKGDEAANAHWTSLYRFSTMKNFYATPKAISAVNLSDIRSIEDKYETLILKANNFKRSQLKRIDSAFNSYKIVRTENNVQGRPVNSINAYEIMQGEMSITEAKNWAKDYGIENAANLLFNIAVAYKSSLTNQQEKQKLTSYFIDLITHLRDQGWAYGSGMGSIHHYGYFFRNYFPACYLMKDVLKQNHLHDDVMKDMQWFSGLGRTLENPASMPLSNIDVFNTLTSPMLAVVLIMDDHPEKIMYLKAYSSWLSHSIGPEYSIEGTFKPGGSITHHGTLYPAYAIDGLKGLTPVIYVLSNTAYAVSDKAYNVVKEALLMMHRYTNPTHFPISVSGRHPTGNWKMVAEPFAYMALAGKGSVDTTLASVYLHVAGTNKASSEFVKQFQEKGFKAADYPKGHWDMNYGLLSIHRRNNWMLTVRGHNRYFVTHESYPGANMYGRYVTYGNTEVFYPGNTDNNGSYFKEDGWDWNHVPGSTTLYLPLEKLRSNILNADDFSGVEEMLLTDEVFCGGSSFKNQGMYAMKLHGHDKYDMGSFRAIKSWFMFDSLIICLGSNINNTVQSYPTHTTLFQNYLADTLQPLYVKGDTLHQFPEVKRFDVSQSLMMLDNRNTGYYLPDAKNLVVYKQKQFSRNQQDTKNTTGNFTGAYFNHGMAPSQSGYHYTMMINSNLSGLEKFAATMQSSNPVYKVLQQDSNAHIVYYAPQQLTAMALFTTHTSYANTLVKEVSRSCMVMYQQNGKQLSFSLTDPDLAFYNGPDDTPLLPDGKRKEVSIYSKKWYAAPAQATVVSVRLTGKWKLQKPEKHISVQYDKKGNTLLHLQCKWGLTNNFELIKNE